ncbi:hypothetical protein TorRG33x02_352080 [Trema orientale]|uniref:Uncharacterized protein n=1 Tax=Trema orientale TaxID=63057 RepID=A0A2P5AF06_TREOI|nr:hypothetical protein TorRG33x02_352080 [Trema orientale]
MKCALKSKNVASSSKFDVPKEIRTSSEQRFIAPSIESPVQIPTSSGIPIQFPSKDKGKAVLDKVAEKASCKRKIGSSEFGLLKIAQKANVLALKEVNENAPLLAATSKSKDKIEPSEEGVL